MLQPSALKGQRDYWNIEDILAEEEHVPCTFKHECKGLGYLDQLEAATMNPQATALRKSKGKFGSLPANARLDIPLWLAVALAQRDIVELRNPKYLS